MRPFAGLGWIPRASRATSVSAMCALLLRWGHKQRIALAAAPSNSLLDGGVDQFVSGLGMHRKHAFLLGLVGGFFLGWCSFLGVARTLFAALVLARRARLVGTKRGSTAMA